MFLQSGAYIMSDYKSLAQDIINNTEKYIVNRDEKMAATIDKMADNEHKKAVLASKRALGPTTESDRGYGKNDGRGTGD